MTEPLTPEEAQILYEWLRTVWIPNKSYTVFERALKKLAAIAEGKRE